MSRLFGTDGIRGIANTELTCELAFRVGQAGAYVLTSSAHKPHILIGQDTRISGKMLVAALTAGICSVGGDVIMVGVIPTPAMAYLVRQYGADAAVMVSASHNSFEYNGIKWFNSKGCKLSDALEDKIEELVNEKCSSIRLPSGAGLGSSTFASNAVKEYVDFLISNSTADLNGIKIALDCANGATSNIAPALFKKLGAEVVQIAYTPNGCNINDACGSTKPEQLQDLVLETGADIGFAFDGDADRLISVDEHGVIVDGDVMMAIMAKDMHASGTLKNNTLVTTVMSNFGMRCTLEKAGIKIETTDVGDRYVLEKMIAENYNLGGEQSGHIIYLDDNTTGDGMLSAIHLLNVLTKNHKRLSELARTIQIFPQILINIKVENGKKTQVLRDDRLMNRVREAEKKMDGNGRVLVRASGTEPLVRVMIEGESENLINSEAEKIAELIAEITGGSIK